MFKFMYAYFNFVMTKFGPFRCSYTSSDQFTNCPFGSVDEVSRIFSRWLYIYDEFLAEAVTVNELKIPKKGVFPI